MQNETKSYQKPSAPGKFWFSPYFSEKHFSDKTQRTRQVLVFAAKTQFTDLVTDRPFAAVGSSLPPGDPRAPLLLLRSIMAAGFIARLLRRALLFRRVA
jgi:hypothetical protein